MSRRQCPITHTHTSFHMSSEAILLKVRDGTLVALKFFRPGSTYEGAIQRERYILDTFVQVMMMMMMMMMTMMMVMMSFGVVGVCSASTGALLGGNWNQWRSHSFQEGGSTDLGKALSQRFIFISSCGISYRKAGLKKLQFFFSFSNCFDIFLGTSP